MKYFLISQLGDTPVSRNNAAFMFCKDLDKVDAMDYGETISATFQSAGTTRAAITRVEDDYEDHIRQLRRKE